MNLDHKRVLVTGGAGFVPSHVVEAFVTQGARVTALDNLVSGKRSNLEKVQNDIHIIEMDVCDGLIRHVIRDQDVVIHMAANADVPRSVVDPEYDFTNNIVGGYNVLKACLHSDIEKFIFASSAAVYGEPQYTPIDEAHPTNPISPYGAAKLSVEKLGLAYHHTFGLPFTVIRIFNTYGTRQPRYVMYDLLNKLYSDPMRLEVLGTGKQVRDYSYVTDTARSFLLATKCDRSVGQIYNVAGGYSISIRDLADRLIRALDLKGVRVSFTGLSWPGDIETLAADIAKAKKELGFVPRVSLEDGIALLNSWLSVERSYSA